MYPDGCADPLENDLHWDLRPKNKWKRKKEKKTSIRRKGRKRSNNDQY
jgi:hypothetical protein